MHTDKRDLEPIDPRTAQELYLEQKSTECAEATVRNHRYHTDKLVEWCEENDVDNLNELTGRNLQEIRLWRKEVGDINLLTLNNHMSTLRVFLQWCASIEAVPETLYDKVMVPRVTPEDEQSDDTLAADAAQEILEYLSTFHYASLDHVLFGVLWETGMRIGAARSIDTEDVDLDEQRVMLRHRPDQGTTLKNGARGERPVALTPDLAVVIGDYLDRV
ncbi:MAG: tyrosine-type recombinase/integrase, partial [Halobacteriaceae archaeon]